MRNPFRNFFRRTSTSNSSQICPHNFYKNFMRNSSDDSYKIPSKFSKNFRFISPWSKGWSLLKRRNISFSPCKSLFKRSYRSLSMILIYFFHLLISSFRNWLSEISLDITKICPRSFRETFADTMGFFFLWILL